jgi:antitoxin FitA
MPSLTLKNIPDELLERLRAAARRDRRSLMQEALYLIEGGLGAHEHRVVAPSAEVQAQVERWREIAGQWRSEQSFEAEVESIAGARSAGRSVDL